jgi:hypothetical protein
MGLWLPLRQLHNRLAQGVQGLWGQQRTHVQLAWMQQQHQQQQQGSWGWCYRGQQQQQQLVV